MQLRFENIQVLWALLPVVGLALYVLFRRNRHQLAFSWVRFSLLHLALMFSILALARPQGGHHETSTVGRSSNVFIALDISRSMLVQDTLPSRIQFAIAFLQRLLPRLTGARFALFPFTLDGYLQVPLTSDVLAVSDLLQALSPNIITMQGTDLTRSLDTLFTRIHEAEDRVRTRGAEWAGAQVLLLTDGESHFPIDSTVLARYRQAHIPVFSLLTGTSTGGPVPMDARSIGTRDATPRSVVSHADPKVLKTVSEGTGGRSFGASFDSLDSVTQHLERAMQLGKLTTTFKVEKEYFPHFFKLVLLLVIVLFSKERWHYAIRAGLFFAILLSGTASANQDNQAIQKYNEGLEQVKKNNMKEAITLFQDAAYLSGNKEVQKKSLYSMGNAYLKSGDTAQALQAYQQAYDTLTGDRSLDDEANQRISDNMVLAAKIEQQQKEQSQKNKKGEGEGEGESKGSAQDQKGPRQFQAQPMDEAMKKKVFDTVSNEERQGIQRTMEKRNRNNNTQSSKPW